MGVTGVRRTGTAGVTVVGVFRLVIGVAGVVSWKPAVSSFMFLSVPGIGEMASSAGPMSVFLVNGNGDGECDKELKVVGQYYA